MRHICTYWPPDAHMDAEWSGKTRLDEYKTARRKIGSIKPLQRNAVAAARIKDCPAAELTTSVLVRFDEHSLKRCSLPADATSQP